MEDRAPPLIRLENISRRYRAGDAEVGALKNVTLDIYAGEFVAVMGPSGSGKTTLMNIIGCLDQPSGGEYFHDGQPVHATSADERARLRRKAFGFVFQDYNLLRMVTAQENVEMPAIYAGTRRRIRWARAAELLSTLGLAHRTGHHPNELSGGERQRVAIARALMNGAAVVLADEPTGSVDSRNGEEIMAQLDALPERGCTIILVTHDPVVARYADRRIELLDGRVVSDTGTNPGRQVSTVGAATAGATRIRAPVASLAESLRTAHRTLRGNKSRTALTLLGIVIGVFSVTAMLGVAQGMRNSIMDSFRHLGGAGIMISPRFGEDSKPLTLSDAEAIRSQIPNLLLVAPEISGGGTLVGGGNSESARITATTGRAMRERGLILAEGIFFDETHSESYAPVVILGGLLAGNLYGERARAVGEYVLINGEPYQVIGVLKRNEGRFGSFDFAQRSAHVPLTTGAARLFDRDNLDSIQVVAANTNQVGTVQNSIEALMSRHHGGSAFRITNQAEIMEVQNNIGRIVSLVFGAIGGISLVVAGIGVMNIMLASVAERTREVGLRMAIGARQRDILMQFVCEAAMVAGLGGAIGLIGALGLGALANSFAPTAVVAFTPGILLVGLSCATLTGVIFGFAPARRAAGMDPVAALRA
ncbi:MAG: ATP-binding cassette domain-containing protein [Gammaproteobacteria bacterium]|nr:ATP-binding cassette domain-containing protein [Gammaproteobacteria bacterium]